MGSDLYSDIVKLPKLASLPIAKLMECASNFMGELDRKNRAKIIEKCKMAKIENLKEFSTKFGQTMDSLMKFLSSTIATNVTKDRLLLVQQKLNFYLNDIVSLNIKNEKEYIEWHAKLICLVKTVNACKAITKCIRINGYDGTKLNAIKRKQFCAEAEAFGSSRGPIGGWFGKTKAKQDGISVDDVCAMI